jgi:hypothetical protein
MVDQARNLLVSLTAVDCCQCGYTIWMADTFIAALKNNKNSFHCTSCGTKQGWHNASEADRLKIRLEAAEKQLAFARNNAASERDAREHTERRLVAQRGVVTRIKNRVGNGVCPCCTRSFGDLKRHMANKHPDYQKDSV